MSGKTTIWLFLGGLLLSGCAGAQPGRPSAKTTDLVLATTTSTQDSGLLDELIPRFEKTHPFRVKTIAVGSGEALAMGKRGEADVLLVHSPQAEEDFMAEGYGSRRRSVMRNQFMLVGPPDDPARAAETPSVTESLKTISRTNALFVSRSDDSGTHKKELRLWQAAGIEPSGASYLESGQGMGETLRIADQKQAYTLTDEGTFLSIESTLSLQPIKTGEAELENPYSVITVSTKLHPKINQRGAEAFSRFVTGSEGQKIIVQFGKETYGKQLFTPNAG